MSTDDAPSVLALRKKLLTGYRDFTARSEQLQAGYKTHTLDRLGFQIEMAPTLFFSPDN